MTPARLVVLVSGSGSNLQALLDACADPRYGARVVAVGADRDGIAGLERATAAGIPTFVDPVAAYPSRSDWDVALTAHVTEHRPDLVISAGFLKLVGPAFLDRFGDRYLNTHNALLPAFPGIHGPRDALAYGVKVAGATLFFVDAGVDTGPIVAQVSVPVLDDDTVDTLTERIKVAERRQLVDRVGRLVREGWTITGRKVTIGVSTSASDDAGRRPIRRALISVYDKTGLVELAQALHRAEVEIVSTGSTAATISGAGIPVTAVEDLTGFPECLDGRVKTLHPRVHAGLLADVGRDEHVAQLRDLAVAPFDLLVSNLYPFQATVDGGGSPDECIEKIDIGGPAMVRAAAKNHASVAVVTDVSAYPLVVAALDGGGFTLAQRRALAARAFADIAEYDVAVATWCASELVAAEAPEFAGLALRRQNVLRYGENPHQRAALYVDPAAPAGLAQAEQVNGKEMSYNNYVDADAAWRAANDFADPAVAIIKHANPCGIAVGADVAQAHRRAHDCDPVSAYGGVIAVNRPVTVELAKQVADVFTEVLVAPGYDDGALEVLAAKKNLRLLRAPAWTPTAEERRPISGGVLVQTPDRVDAPGDDPATWRLVAGPAASPETLADLAFAWRACRSVKSNAILLASDGASVGVGMGQVSRVESAKLAVARAGQDRARGAVAASDAYFPFADGLLVLIEAGVRAVVQPGGSKRDPEVIEAATKAGITMYVTGTRHFYH